MKKKLVIKFWKAEKALAMQIVEQEGLPERKETGFVQIRSVNILFYDELCLRGCDTRYDYYIERICFYQNLERDEFLNKAVDAITDELFSVKPKVEVNGEVITYTWEEE